MARSSPRRVTHLIGDLALGGAQRQLLHLLGALDPSEFQSEVLTWRDGPGRLALAARLPDGVSHRHLPRAGRPDWTWLLQLRAHLKRARTELVHAWLNPAAWWAVAATAGRSTPVLSHELVTRLPDWRMRIHRLTSVAVADSQAVLERLPRARRVLIPPGVPVAQPGPAADAPGRVVLCLGSLQPDKGQDLLVRLAHSRSECFVLMGPVEDAVFAARLRREAPASVRFEPASLDPSPWLRRADLLVLPSRTESAPNVVLEALAYGVPIVASDVGDVSRLLDGGRLGRLIPPGDEAALAAALGDVIPVPDGPLWVARRYSVAAMVGRFAALYRRLIP